MGRVGRSYLGQKQGSGPRVLGSQFPSEYIDRTGLTSVHWLTLKISTWHLNR
jgi:hypothetical protein